MQKTYPNFQTEFYESTKTNSIENKNLEAMWQFFPKPTPSAPVPTSALSLHWLW